MVGAVLGLATSWYLARRAERRESTMKIVTEFFSDEFLAHRISVSRTRRKRDADEVSIDDLARGYWFPGGGNSYQGELYKDMNEHQHVEAYIGFLIRIHYLATRGRLDVRELSAAIGMPLKYHMPLLCQIASASRRQAPTGRKKDT